MFKKGKKEVVGELKMERDRKTGHITKFTVPSEMSEKALTGMLFVLADSLNISVDKFSKSSARYARAMLFLTAALIVVAIIQVVTLCVG